MELNTENMFDCQHDSMKNDYEFLPDAPRHWNRTKYWQKVNRIGQEIASASLCLPNGAMPDVIGLCEVENDTVLRDLTQRSLLRQARYEYVMTHSPDERGIDVALLYSPFAFRLISCRSLRVPLIKDMRPTRDILYAKGEVLSGDTLARLCASCPQQAGRRASLAPLQSPGDGLFAARHRLHFGSSAPRRHRVHGRFQRRRAERIAANVVCPRHDGRVPKREREPRSARHIPIQRAVEQHRPCACEPSPGSKVQECLIHDEPFLLEPDTKYGGVKPRRYYNGMRFNDGFSDHLPLVMRLVL